MSDIALINCALRDSGAEELGAEGGRFVLEGMQLLDATEVEGLSLKSWQAGDKYYARITIAPGARIERPVRLCIGMLREDGVQRLDIEVEAGAGSSASLVAHCIFPTARKVLHAMDARVHVGRGAMLNYAEHHFHGPYGGAEVIPKAVVTMDEDSRYTAEFSLLKGRVGRLDIDYEVHAAKGAVVELLTRVMGSATDEIKIREFVSLDGAGARGIVKSRVAVSGNARAEVTGGAVGNAAGSRGHVDCIEIVRDSAVARAVPIVAVTHPEAKVTHEAAIGSVDKRQMETLMAHGLKPEQAVDLIITGLMGGAAG